MACITTAVALVSSAGEYFSRLSQNRIGYSPLVVVICVFSAIISNLGLDMIVAVASPILNMVYAPALTLIILTLFGKWIKKDSVFKGAALGALITSVIETAASFQMIPNFAAHLPLASLGFAWVVPAFILGLIGWLIPDRKAGTL